MKDLSEIRLEIDAVDKEILRLYEERLKLAEDVAEYKIANGKKVYDKEREIAKLDALSSQAEGDFAKQGVRELFEQIMSTSRKKQYQILSKHGLLSEIDFTPIDKPDYSQSRICYQGVEGAYSQQAMLSFFGDQCKNSFNVHTWRDAMEAIKNKKADYAVLPIENSSAGTISENFDLLLEYGMSIVGEQFLRINHALLANKDADISDITSVYSHPQALSQCSKYLLKNNNWNACACENTAVAAKLVKDSNDKTLAAIGSELNADIYGLKILDKAIQNNIQNETRFIIVSDKKEYVRDSKKISIVLEISNEPGSLYQAISHFIFNGLDMTSIQSRPIPGRNWEYSFFIDVIGNLSDPAVKNALLGLREEAGYFRILGNY